MSFYNSITNNIQEALMSDDRTADASIEVINEQGIITLTGEVKSYEIAQVAEEIVKRQKGVFKVVNGLRISTSKEGAMHAKAG